MSDIRAPRIEDSHDEHRGVRHEERSYIREKLLEIVQNLDGDRREQYNQEPESDPYKKLARIISACEISPYPDGYPCDTRTIRPVYTILVPKFPDSTVQQLLRLQKQVRDNERNENVGKEFSSYSGLSQHRRTDEVNRTPQLPRYKVRLPRLTGETLHQTLCRAIGESSPIIQEFKKGGSCRITWEGNECTVSFD